MVCAVGHSQKPQISISTTNPNQGLKHTDQPPKQKLAIENVLDAWHKAASNAKMDEYFSYMASDGIFIGTDNTENWNIAEFKAFAKPYFDRGKAWNFKEIERNVYMTKEMAWFDELLDTPNMKTCRGSGVLRLENGQWKIVHYVLSMTIPNDLADQVTKMKTNNDDKFVKELAEKKK